MGTNCRSLMFLMIFCLAVQFCDVSSAQQTKRPLTIADEIELALFIPDIEGPNPRFSPDGKYFAVYSERGRLDSKLPEDSLRFYHSADVENFLKHSDESQLLPPVWDIHLSTDKEGPIIHDWRWLPDSSGVAFLQSKNGNQKLVLADLRREKIEELTSEAENVENYDIRDRDHYVYTAADPVELKMLKTKKETERQAAAFVGTGLHLGELLMPEDPIVVKYFSLPRVYLWAGLAGKRFMVKHDGAAIVPEGDLSLSPDGRSIATSLPVVDVPKSWETLYPPPFASSSSRIRAGHSSPKQYVRIDLQTRSIQSLTNAPVSAAAGWWAYGSPSWSSNGQEILLSGTFLGSKENVPSRPCVAVVNLSTDTRTCVEVLKARTETGQEKDYYTVSGVRFVGGDGQRVEVSFELPDGTTGASEYRRMANGSWEAIAHNKVNKGKTEPGYGDLEVTIRQGLDKPPLLVASDKEISRVIWDPNPQLKNIEIGRAHV